MKTVFKKCIIVILTLAVMLAAGLISRNSTVYASAGTSISGTSLVTGMPDGFARGVDVSALTSLENSGIEFHYLDGSQGDMFDILSGAGVNYVRIRIWNNPYDSSAPYKPYGGGNCDLYNAKILGKRATDAGMKVFIDFHYSDFWADPEKQFAPKAWADYNLTYKKDAVYNFTYDSLKELLDYGVNIGMVQIGNETNGSMCGIGGLYDGVWDLSSGVAALMQQGCYAVNDINTLYGKSLLKVLHFTDLVERGEWYAECVDKLGVDYDVFSTSYYPMWHGTASDLTTKLTNIARTYNKKVMVAETAYPYTYENFDSQNNNIGDASGMTHSNYNISVFGQAEALRDIFAAVAKVNETKAGYGIGAFYWEPGWIATNSSAWGTCGSGWATSATGNYEKLYSNSVNYYSTVDGGSTWDNMTLFDKNGNAMKSLYVFNDICGKASTISSGIFNGGSLEGTYYIKSAFNGLYLDVAGGSSSDNANIQQNSYLGNNRQKFKLTRNKDGYYYIFTGASGYSKALDIAGKKTTDGTNVVQYSYNGGTNQMFELAQISPGIYAIKTRITDSSSCLDVFEWSQEPGSNIVQWNYWGGDCQLWILEAAY